MSIIYGALSAAILWAVYLFFKNFKKSFSGESSKHFCIISAVLFGLFSCLCFYLGFFVSHGGSAGHMVIFLGIISLILAVCSGINTKKQNKN